MKLYQDRDWLHQKYWGEKLSTVQIGKLCDVASFTISCWMKKLGIKIRTFSEAAKRKDGPFENKSWLYQKYWNEKLSITQIAELCEISRSAINQRMNEFNISRRILSEANKINQNRPEVKKKISAAAKLTQNRPEIKKAHRKRSKKLWTNPEYRKKVIETSKIGKNRPEVKKKMSDYSKKLWRNPEYRKKTSEANKIASNQPKTKKKKRKMMKKLWQEPEYVKKTLKATKKRPTWPEQVFDDLTPICVRYVGNSAWWRKLPNGKNKNPDFKVTGQNKIIEIYGDYWHDKKYFPQTLTPQELIDLYAQAGFKCLVFWEREIYDNPEQVKEKVNNFINQ